MRLMWRRGGCQGTVAAAKGYIKFRLYPPIHVQLQLNSLSMFLHLPRFALDFHYH
jgi:hypothetical protein